MPNMTTIPITNLKFDLVSYLEFYVVHIFIGRKHMNKTFGK